MKAQPGTPIRVLLVEDSPTQAGPLTRALQHEGDIVLLGQSVTGDAVLTRVLSEMPDVIILGLSTADAAGQCFIGQVMAHAPTPILVLSALIMDRHSAAATEALVAGALEALPLPGVWNAEREAALRHTVRQLSKVHVIRHPRGGQLRSVSVPGPGPGAGAAATAAGSAGTASDAPPRGGVQRAVVALAASTGGPKALATVLAGLGGLRAPVLVVQHLHPDFTGGLFDWMRRDSALPVEMAVHNQIARAGCVYLAPGGTHLRLAANLRLELASTPVSIHQPSADELFRSVAQHAGPAGVGVILTGMGDDGARGLLELRNRGGKTFGQDQASCAVFGMPQAAHRLGAVTSLLPPDQLADEILRAVTPVWS